MRCSPLDMYLVSQKTSTASRSTENVAYTCRGFAETDGRAPRPEPGAWPDPEPRRHPDPRKRALESSGFACRELKEGSDVYGSRGNHAATGRDHHGRGKARHLRLVPGHRLRVVRLLPVRDPGAVLRGTLLPA